MYWCNVLLSLCSSTCSSGLKVSYFFELFLSSQKPNKKVTEFDDDDDDDDDDELYSCVDVFYFIKLLL